MPSAAESKESAYTAGAGFALNADVVLDTDGDTVIVAQSLALLAAGIGFSGNAFMCDSCVLCPIFASETA